MSTEVAEVAAARRVKELAFFWFLVDAPMFTDNSLIDRFHDAVIRPESIVTAESDQRATKEETARKLGVTGQGKASVPFVVDLALKGNFENRFKRGEEASYTRQLDIPRTPERLLEEIVAFYLANFPERVLRVFPKERKVSDATGSEKTGTDTLDAVCDTPGPRPIVLIDAPPGTKIMPMAGEFVNGHLDVIYDDLVASLSTADEPLKKFSRGMSEDDKAQRWGELVSKFDARVAMHVLEGAGRKHGEVRFEWIDFRMPWGNVGNPSPLHLHIVPAGRYSMGTFAHAFVRRADSNGVRIVGTLKTGGDINVLAMYER